jgi:hypothetical protein
MNVFISYAREDQDRARTLSMALEACGWSVWWDPKIQAGQSFDEIIERELDTADCVVVLWSKHSISSEWVKNEASEGLARGVLIPARIDDIKLPLEFRRRQTAELVGWNGDPSHAGFKGLCNAVAGMVPRPAETSPAGGGARLPQPVARNRGLVFGGIAVAAVLLAVGYGAVSRNASTREQDASRTPAVPEVRVEVSRDFPPSSGSVATGAPGIFDFKWPGTDCWKISRRDVVAKSGCGGGRHALQAGDYLVSPSSSAVFAAFAISVEPGGTIGADADAGTFEFNWPGTDCWTIYRGDVEAKRGCGGGTHALQAGTYLLKPSSSAVFVPFSVAVKSGTKTSADGLGGVFQFNWPGSDCWKAYRGDVVAKSGCGGGKHALQEGVYTVRPSSSAVFEPFSVRVLRSKTTATP